MTNAEMTAVAAHADRQAEYARDEARRWADVAQAFERVAARCRKTMKEIAHGNKTQARKAG